MVSGFFRSAVGASVGDIITSIIATAVEAGVNVFEYLNALQRNAARVKKNPEQWMSWNYEETLKQMAG